PRASTQGALFAIVGGVASWILIEALIGAESLVPPQLIGLGISAAGMVAGSLLPQWLGNDGRHAIDRHAALHHRAASQSQHTAARNV
ncbi:MAG: hypothetical protein RIR18_1132, partial [Pseudomonadota bacterium]